jgi:uncharacterized protein involved in exopolysaccharide biosynthesis
MTQPDISARDLTRRIASRRNILIGIPVVVVAAVGVWILVATPRYRSEARLRIANDQGSGGLMSAFADQATAAIPGAAGAAGGLLGGLGKDELETEIGVLKSDRITDAMVDSLALGVQVTDPADSRARVLSARTIDPDIDVDGKLTFERQPDGKYKVERSKLEEAGDLPAVVTPGQPFRVGGFQLALNPTLATGGESKIVAKILPRYKVHKLLEKRLIIERQPGGSRLVEISYEDPDRVLAQRAVNTIINEYTNYTSTNERLDDTTAAGRLRLQVDSTTRALSIAENKLRDYEERTRLIDPKEQSAAQVKRIATISGKVDAVSVERNALQKMLTIIGTKSKNGTDATAYRQLATFPSLITNRAIQDLLQSLVDLENKRSALGVRRTENNDEYKAYTNRITEIERQLYELGPQYLESLDQQLGTAATTVTALADTLNLLPGIATRYGQLLRDRTVLETIYIALMKQLKTTELKDVMRPDRVRIVDRPRIANRKDPVFPRKAVMLSLAAVLGVALALTIALGIEIYNDKPSAA